MPDPYAECIKCNYQFFEPDIDEHGLRIECPECGERGRRYTLKVSGGVYAPMHPIPPLSDAVGISESVAVKVGAVLEYPPDIEAQFDVEEEIDGHTIIQCSSLVDQKLIEYFHENPQEMKKMDRRLFEELVAELYRGFGYEVELTKQTKDGGIDIIAIGREIVEVKYLIQCKRPDPGNIVGVEPVRQLYCVKVREKATKAILATTARFSKDAKIEFADCQWELELREYEDLKEWIKNYLTMIGKSAS
jgi:restriction endonuclease Mrr